MWVLCKQEISKAYTACSARTQSYVLLKQSLKDKAIAATRALLAVWGVAQHSGMEWGWSLQQHAHL